MDQEINDNEVLSDNQSAPTTRPSSSTSSDMLRANLQSRSDTFSKRRSSNIDVNDSPTNQQINEPTSTKILIFNGKCSKVFRSVVEECVEDCILEFPNEKQSIYVPKSRQAAQIPTGSNRNSVVSIREPSANARLSARSNRRRNSITQHNTLPQMNVIRNNLPNAYSLPAAALAATAALRMRQQLVQQKFPLAENISEETTDQQSTNEQIPVTNLIEPETQAEQAPIVHEEPIAALFSRDLSSISLPSFPFDIKPSNKVHSSYRDRQKEYRLSDLVMLGPEYFRDVFNLPHQRSQSQPRNHKKTEQIPEIERIKQDLFHRYLWTQKPQVSCRIRPLSTYTRDTTFVI